MVWLWKRDGEFEIGRCRLDAHELSSHRQNGFLHSLVHFAGSSVWNEILTVMFADDGFSSGLWFTVHGFICSTAIIYIRLSILTLLCISTAWGKSTQKTSSWVEMTRLQILYHSFNCLEIVQSTILMSLFRPSLALRNPLSIGKVNVGGDVEYRDLVEWVRMSHSHSCISFACPSRPNPLPGLCTYFME